MEKTATALLLEGCRSSRGLPDGGGSRSLEEDGRGTGAFDAFDLGDLISTDLCVSLSEEVAVVSGGFAVHCKNPQNRSKLDFSRRKRRHTARTGAD